MTGAVLFLVLFTFVTGMLGLLVMIASITRNRDGWTTRGARVIFDPGEEGATEEPSVSAAAARELGVRADLPGAGLDERQLRQRRACDTSARRPVRIFLYSALFWLMIGSVAGLLVSLKMTYPDWLVQHAATTFGRLRPFHLNAVIYGWSSMGGIAVGLWLVPRLAHRPLLGGEVAVWAGYLWNLGMVAGLTALLGGWTDGLEWLEFPWPVDISFVVAGAMAGFPMLLTLQRKRTRHLYVSAWYYGASLLWFPILFVVANLPNLHFGTEHAIVNWWFAHNVLGLWLTPIGLAIAYYFIPKVLGRPVYSYGLSLIGFWSLALFYSQVGVHHLIGGPVPTWLVTVSIVHSVMMFVPVIAVAINHHWTVAKSFFVLRHSPTLRFVVTGAMLYTFTSFEGSLESLRAVNRVTHFTHFTVAHAHAGVYGFLSFELFGAIYFLLPRLLEREWPYPKLVRAHFWLALAGIVLYIVGLSIGGILQGLAMLDGKRPFIDSVLVSIPYLHARTVGGAMMTLSHLLFVAHVWCMATGRGCAAASTESTPPAEVHA